MPKFKCIKKCVKSNTQEYQNMSVLMCVKS